jgi:hypothetical protein
MTKPRTRRKFLKENNKTKKNQQQTTTKKGRGRRGTVGSLHVGSLQRRSTKKGRGRRGTVGSLHVGSLQYKGGEDSSVTTYYNIFENPLVSEKNKNGKDLPYDKSYLNKFIIKQYSKINFGSFKKFLSNIDEKIALIRKGRTGVIVPTGADKRKDYELKLNNFGVETVEKDDAGASNNGAASVVVKTDSNGSS